MERDVLSLLKEILTRSSVVLSDLERITKTTRRQLIYRLDKINYLLKINNVDLISITETKKLVITNKTRDFLINYFFDSEINCYFLDKKERKIYIFLWLFLDCEYLSLQHFMSRLKISHATAINDIAEYNEQLKKEHVQISYTRKGGYYLSGDEIDIRKVMVKTIILATTDFFNDIILKIAMRDFEILSYAKCDLIIQKLALKYNINFVENRLCEFIYLFAFLSVRVTCKKDHLCDHQLKTSLDLISDFKEYKFTQALIQKLDLSDQVQSNDIAYIASWILGISFGNYDEETKDRSLIAHLVQKILNRFEILSGIKFSDRESVFRHIYSHFRPAYYRLLYQLPIINPLRERVINEYGSLYYLVKETMKHFNKLFNVDISDDELAYLTVHFSAVYINLQKDLSKVKKALIICLNGTGSSVLIYNELKSMFPQIYFYHPIKFSELDLSLYESDIIFTTKWFKQLNGLNIPIIKISPVMDVFERHNTIKEVVKILGLSTYVSADMDGIVNILIKNGIKQKNALEIATEIISKIHHVAHKEEQLSKKTLSFLELVNTEIMILQDHSLDALSSINKIGSLMVKNNFISKKYLKDVLDIQMKNPSYFIITDEIALPHNKASNEVLRNAIGILTLAKPIKFSNKDKRLIKYIFFLAIKNNLIHIQAMNQLLRLINTNAFMHLLSKEKKATNLVKFIENSLNKKEE